MMNNKRKLATPAVVLLFAVMAFPVFLLHAAEIQVDVKEKILDNGLTILVVERHGAPVFSAFTQFRVGSANETTGMTGAAHFLEHLLFKGTKTLGTSDYKAEEAILQRLDEVATQIASSERTLKMKQQLALTGSKQNLKESEKEIEDLRLQLGELQEEHSQFVVRNEVDQILTVNGAVGLNASTGYDTTQYYVSLPSTRLELWARIESERMQDPVFREFYRERDVVIEERRLRVDNSPELKIAEQIIGAAYLAHPYRIFWEWPTDVAAITHSGIREFYTTYYAPNRAVIALVGDLDPEEVFRTCEKYFGPIPRQPDPPPIVTTEPSQMGEKRVEIRMPAEPQVAVAYHKTAFYDTDELALRVTKNLLTRDRTSRLYRSLVEDLQLAVAVDSFEFPGTDIIGALHPNLIIFQALPREGVSLDKIEEAMYAEFRRLSNEPVSEKELTKIKNNLAADLIRRARSNMGLASMIGDAAGRTGDWRYILGITERLLAVSPEDVSRVVGQYFTAQNRTVATIVKTDPETDEMSKSEAGGQS